MIPDEKTNSLYLADCLPKKQPKFFQRFEKILIDCNIQYSFLPNTKDIWAVDFMPVQISKDEFVQFTYNPDYLQPKKYPLLTRPRLQRGLKRLCEAHLNLLFNCIPPTRPRLQRELNVFARCLLNLLFNCILCAEAIYY